MGSFYRSQHEFIFVFKHGRAAHLNNIQLGRFGRNRTNVWSYPGASTPAGGDEERGLLDLHPTVKPVTLVADALMDCSPRNGIVLDPFSGSGSTIIAAERTGRRARVIELDPRFVDVAIHRWQRFTRQRAIHFETRERHLERRKLAVIKRRKHSPKQGSKDGNFEVGYGNLRGSINLSLGNPATPMEEDVAPGLL